MSKLGSNISSALGVELGSMSTATRNSGVSTATGTVIYNSTDDVVQVYNGTGWDTLSNTFTATGGNVDAQEPGNGFAYHTFTSPGVFTVESGSKTVEIFVDGAGGGGGSCNQNGGSDGGAGGGGGGVVSASYPNLAPGTYNITVGTGGAGGPARSGTNNSNPVNQQAGLCSPGRPQPYNGDAGTTGGDSIFAASSSNTIKLTAKGGGGGGSGPNAGNEDCGGSGGGGGGGGNPTLPGAPSIQGPQNADFIGTINQYGNSGGSGPSTPPFIGGGGGGAGGAGGAGGSGGPGLGGSAREFTDYQAPKIGVPGLNPISGFFGGGGGGGDGGGSYTGNSRAGGFGAGVGASQNVNATNGLANSGGGGGGGSGITGKPATDPHGFGASGAPGLVVIRYEV